MPTTYAQRLTECLDLMKAGKGLTAIPLADRDIVLVKDPTYHTPANSTAVVVWVEYAGGAARTAYGL